MMKRIISATCVAMMPALAFADFNVPTLTLTSKLKCSHSDSDSNSSKF